MKSRYSEILFLVFVLFFLLGTGVASAQEGAVGVTDRGWIAIAAGITMAGATIGAGLGIAATGTAATGATAEKPEVFGRVLIFVALAEALAIYGLLFAFMLWIKI